MKRLKFVWIDDQKQKVEAYRAAIEAGLPHLKLVASIELIEVQKELIERLTKWTEENQTKPPDLFIIDHVFTASLPFGLKGSSVAHLLRNEFSTTPMVCVTAKFDQEDLSEYMAVFLYTQLEQHVEDLYAIARDFRKLSPSNANTREYLVTRLKAPARDHEDLLRVLPDEFQNQKHATTEHRMARWVYSVLLERPGFLYDRLHVATLLGLTTSGFAKIESLFTKARYKGVFATDGQPKWWLSEVRRLLFAQTDTSGPDLPQLAGRALPGISESDYSVCYVSKKSHPPPDTVVWADATREPERRVVRRTYAARHPNDPGTTPGFETRLVLAKKSKSK